MGLMKRIILWTGLALGIALALTMTSCAGLKVNFETELDANAGNLLNLFN